MTDWIVIYEHADDGSWWARAADLPVFVGADSREQAERVVREAIIDYVELLREQGEPVPDFRGEAGVVSA